MDISDKNILNVYKNYKKSTYIINNFTNKKELGIYYKDNTPYSPKNKNFGLKVVDTVNEYKINDLGFRGKLYESPEILAIGCSYTFGVGVPEDGTWPSILGSEINKDILNLGVPGATIKKTLELMVSYVSKYDKPKTIFALLPPFFRTSLIEDLGFYSSSRNVSQKDQQEINSQISFQSKMFCNRSKEEMFFEKRDSPYQFKSKAKNITYMENVLSPHQFISDSIDLISMMEDFCNSHKINLYWSTWDNPTSMLMDVLLEIPNFKLKKYVKFANDEFNNYQTNDSKFPNNLCNLTHDSKLIDHPSWEVGSDVVYYYDIQLKDTPPHCGIHFQYHAADLFKNLYLYSL
jgi:hypothetical protein